MARRQAKVRLTDEADAGWSRLQAERNATLTALIEAIGLELAEGRAPISQQALDRARSIDVDRHSRR